VKHATGCGLGSSHAISLVFLWIAPSSFSIPAWSVGFEPISPDELKMTGNAKARGSGDHFVPRG
jgi:hypothetical protein